MSTYTPNSIIPWDGLIKKNRRTSPELLYNRFVTKLYFTGLSKWKIGSMVNSPNENGF